MFNNIYYLFVYGSLKQGFSNNHLLNDALYIGPATTCSSTFSMYNLKNYPGVTEDGKNSIHGELYRVSNMIIRRLNILEGAPIFFKLSTTKVSLNDPSPNSINKIISASIYLLNNPKCQSKNNLMESGIWPNLNLEKIDKDTEKDIIHTFNTCYLCNKILTATNSKFLTKTCNYCANKKKPNYNIQIMKTRLSLLINKIKYNAKT